MPPSTSVTTTKNAVKSVGNSITASVANGVEKSVNRPGFPLGKKELYLPKHVLTFIRPKEGQPPNLATFKVPLTFNKFDFRDYLWNCYNVEVSSVRSFINQRLPKQRSYGAPNGGKWYRPRSIKMMIADLKQPFVWPEAPEDKEPWDNKLFKTIEDAHTKRTKLSQVVARGRPKMRSRGDAEPSRVQLARAARLLAYGLAKWKPQSDTTRRIEEAKSYVPLKKPKAGEMLEEADTPETVNTSEAEKIPRS